MVMYKIDRRGGARGGAQKSDTRNIPFSVLYPKKSGLSG